MKHTLIILTILIGFVFAENPTLNVQGVLRDENGNAVPDGENYQLTFYLYDAVEGGSSIWSEDHTGVSVANGVYSAELGGVSSLGGLTFASPYYLGIAVNGGAESTPRIPLSMSPYALSVRGATNTFPNDGNVIIGGTTGDHKLEIQNGNIEIQNDNADAQIRFTDPNDRWMYMGIDQSDDHKFKIGTGAVLGEDDHLIIDDDNGDLTVNGGVTVNGANMFDKPGGYDVWIQGSTGSTSSGDGRNLAILGRDDENGDLLEINYNNEYEAGTKIGGPVNIAGDLQVDGSLQVGGGSVLGKIQVGQIGDGSNNSAGYSGTVTFSTPFSSPPMVFLQNCEFNNAGTTSARIIALSATSFTWNSFMGATLYSADQIFWMAIGN